MMILSKNLNQTQLLNPNNKIINYVPTGTQTTRENSKAPLTPQEIIEDVQRAYELGITLVHLHARDNDLKNTYKTEFYHKIIEGVRTYCKDLEICVSLSGRLFNEFEKRTEVLELMPDMASLTLSSLNFPSSASVNDFDTIIKILEKMKVFGVIPELECFDSGMVNFSKYLFDRNYLEGPIYYNIILGNLFNAQCQLSTLSDIKNNQIKDSVSTLGGIGNQQLKSNLFGLLEFDGIRIGLEDNLYLRSKEKTTNHELLERILRIMKELDLEVLSSKELKDMGFVNKISNL